MNKMHKLALVALVAGAGIMSIQQASAWWGGNRWNDDDWYDRPGYWRYGGPYGWGGGPYGWGGGPYGWGGWGYPGLIAPQTNTSSSTPAPKYPE